MATQQQHTNGRVKGDTAPPVDTSRLVKRVGVTRAAGLLGVSTTTLHKARRSGCVSRVVEVAAHHVLPTLDEKTPAPRAEPKQRPEGETTVVLLEVQRAQLPTVEKLASALHAEILITA